jgi:hypothetical protein
MVSLLKLKIMNSIIPDSIYKYPAFLAYCNCVPFEFSPENPLQEKKKRKRARTQTLALALAWARKLVWTRTQTQTWVRIWTGTTTADEATLSATLLLMPKMSDHLKTYKGTADQVIPKFLNKIMFTSGLPEELCNQVLVVRTVGPPSHPSLRGSGLS